MRLFIAIDVNDAIRDEMRRVRAMLEASLETLSRPPRITWVSPDNAHVTLRFLGEVPEDAAMRLRQAIDSPIALAPFDLTWHGVGAFPSARAPRTIWIGGSAASDQLRILGDHIASRVDPLFGSDDSRPFKAHLTIARVRDRNARVDWRAMLSSAHGSPVVSTIDHVTLYESRLSPKGPTYTALARAALA